VWGSALNSTRTAWRKRDTRGAADEDHFVNLFSRDAGVGHAVAARAQRLVDDRRDELLQHLAGDFATVAAALVVEGDGGGGERGELVFGVDDGAAQGLHGDLVAGEIGAPFGGDVFERDAQQEIIEIVAAEMRVAIGGQHFKDAVVELQNRDVERAAAEIINSHNAVLPLVDPVGQRGRGGLVDQTHHLQPGDAAGVLGGLALGVVEVRRHGDDGVVNGFAEIGFGIAFELAKDLRADTGRGEALAAKLQLNDRFRARGDVEGEELQLVLHVGHTAAHQAFDGVDRPVRMGDQPFQRGAADDRFAVFGNGDHAGDDGVAVGARDDLGRGEVHEGHERVGGAEIDADNFVRLIFVPEIDLEERHEFGLSESGASIAHEVL